MNKSRKILLPGAGLALAVLATLLLIGPMSDGPAQATIVLPTDPEISKTLDSGLDPIGIYLATSTTYVYTITYDQDDVHAGDPAVRIVDAIPAEFEKVSLVASTGTVNFNNRGKAADRIEWDLPADTDGTLTVTVQTVANPGKGHRADVFKPTTCGDLEINPGATAYEVDPVTMKIVKVLNPVTLELEAVIVSGPSNSLVVEAVAGAKPCAEG